MKAADAITRRINNAQVSLDDARRNLEAALLLAVDAGMQGVVPLVNAALKSAERAHDGGTNAINLLGR